MTNFTRRRRLPMQPSSYRAAARKLRKWADALDEAVRGASLLEAQTMTDTCAERQARYAERRRAEGKVRRCKWLLPEHWKEIDKLIVQLTGEKREQD